MTDVHIMRSSRDLSPLCSLVHFAISVRAAPTRSLWVFRHLVLEGVL